MTDCLKPGKSRQRDLENAPELFVYLYCVFVYYCICVFVFVNVSICIFKSRQRDLEKAAELFVCNCTRLVLMVTSR